MLNLLGLIVVTVYVVANVFLFLREHSIEWFMRRTEKTEQFLVSPIIAYLAFVLIVMFAYIPVRYFDKAKKGGNDAS